ncbi:putative phage abortive infection protein [Aliarcobacter butzleri]|uniref:putative phage abortive infection protein n=1 Tax=Aliarcobacter butzleri TaxID=28197 RepID=UPI00244CD17B|nr:putative phage abortive infection protein [Aliarcobacter butzleri]MDH1975793.1 putative phage abortive infection protein [Aliarcobacter butzleri]
MASEEKNSSKLNFLNWILIIAVCLFIGLIIAYFSFIISQEDTVKSNWGTFGDFIGGTLNPIFALFSLFAIIYTIKIQTKELELSREELEATRKELEGSRIAQQEQSESLKLQNQATKLQMFENTFFKLFEQHNEMLDNCYNSHGIISILNYQSNRVNDVGEVLKDANKNELIDNFRYTNQHNNAVKNYFMVLYQLLKFIDIQCIKNNFDAKFFTNMVRAILDNEILKALAINIVAYKDFAQYKKYVERYELFEHLYIDDKDVNSNLLFDVLIEYDKKAFEKNEKILEKYNELKESKQ